MYTYIYIYIYARAYTGYIYIYIYSFGIFVFISYLTVHYASLFYVTVTCYTTLQSDSLFVEQRRFEPRALRRVALERVLRNSKLTAVVRYSRFTFFLKQASGDLTFRYAQ